ncbi:MAG: hypothetical protein K0S65_2683 [Labilithrix sp.]|nr:hypothetical protein [Labilithrix sp.]
MEPSADHHALLVVYPRSACSGSARTLFVDAKGTFYGAVAPGEAALLSVPNATRRLLTVSSVEITSPVGTWFVYDEVRIDPPPDGVMLRALEIGSRHCGSGHYAEAAVATKSELESALAEAEIRWLEPRVRDGQAWLDARRSRVDEILGLSKARPAHP